jgi:hypothetical protein
MDVNQVIGKRLAQVVGRGRGTAFCKSKPFRAFLGEEWDKQTYYDAISGRRFFRVSELIGLARAAGVPVHELVDANPLGVSKVTMGRKSRKAHTGAVTISAAELVDQFKAPGEAQGPMWRALLEVREILGELPALVVAARKAEKELKVFYPSLPALDEEGTK